MSLPQLPDLLRFGQQNDPFHLEFDRRTGHYTMAANHYHEEYELYYLFNGERNYFIKDSAYHIHSGDLVLVESNAVHKTSDMGVPNHERVVLYFTPAYFDGYSAQDRELLLAPFTHGNPLMKLNLQQRLQVEGLLSSLLAELHARPPGYQLHIRHMAGELLLFIARSFQRRETNPHYEPTPAQKKVSDIVRYINLHFNEPIGLDSLSRRFFISKSHLSRMFKEVTGFGFSEYINITRIKEAERLLRETDHSITRVSELAGFDNFSHFGKMFKKLSGLTPRAYRRLGRNE
ncbi:AraC family transcriptional regulator [Paenibacillus sp. M1]|uniref:AraC family transcriptional regulator n=1 Tax=Paenibacillus haidiansis TaxID=1574488 RepID=A0ABU7VUJ9_9BACL